MFAVLSAQRLVSVIDLLERVALRFEREESPQQKLSKLEGFLCSMACRWRRSCPLRRPALPAADRRLCPLNLSPEQGSSRLSRPC